MGFGEVVGRPQKGFGEASGRHSGRPPGRFGKASGGLRPWESFGEAWGRLRRGFEKASGRPPQGFGFGRTSELP